MTKELIHAFRALTPLNRSAGLRPAATLEQFKKYCSHSGMRSEEAVFLVFGFVLAQLQGFANLRLRQSLAKDQKSSLRIGYSIF